MQKKTFDKIGDVFVTIGALTYAALLIIELSRDNPVPPQVFFSAAMLAFCLAYMATWLPVSEAAKTITAHALVLVTGAVLAVAFTVFAFQAENSAQLGMSVFVACLGVVTFIMQARRIKIRRIPTGGQR